MRKHTLQYGLAAALGCLLSVGQLQAADYWRAPVARTTVRTPRAPSVPVARGAFRRPIDKPFAGMQQRPTVSPWLNLTRSDSDFTANYQTLVRPQLEQLEFNRQAQGEFRRLEGQFQDLRTRAAFPAGGDTELRETGHASRFQYLSHFFPR